MKCGKHRSGLTLGLAVIAHYINHWRCNHMWKCLSTFFLGFFLWFFCQPQLFLMLFGKTYNVHVLQIIVLSNKTWTKRTNGCVSFTFRWLCRWDGGKKSDEGEFNVGTRRYRWRKLTKSFMFAFFFFGSIKMTYYPASGNNLPKVCEWNKGEVSFHRCNFLISYN